MDPDLQVLDELGQLGISAARVTTYNGSRRKRDGNSQFVRIEIFDYGPNYGGPRYWVKATADGKTAQANGMPTIQAALAVVNWFDLD